MRVVALPWATRIWALPVVTVLAPSERDQQERGQRHTTLPDWARQLVLVVWRWRPERPLGVVTERSVAVMTLGGRVRQRPQPLCGIPRGRLEAARYAPAPLGHLGRRADPACTGGGCRPWPTRGRRRPGPARSPPGWAGARWSPCGPAAWPTRTCCRSDKPCGLPTRCRPWPRPSPSCASTGGPRRRLTCPRRKPTWSQSPAPC
jgi:hypothetical protein